MDPSHRPYAVIVVLLTACLVLASLLLRAVAREAHGPTAIGLDASDRSALVDRMAADSGGLFDSHPDPDVGRVLLPHLDQRTSPRLGVETNRFGLRERDYAVPKEPETTRVVLLGDSYVFGMSVQAEDRAGVFLERFLRERAEVADPESIEVLHVGVPSWNLVGECAWLSRQLGVLQPDLVIHVSVQNDLDDANGARGFGALAKSVPSRPRQADTVISSYYPQMTWPTSGPHGQLARGVDWEGRQRFAAAGDAVERLSSRLAERGARYLHVFQWGAFDRAAQHFLAPRLPPAEVAWLSGAFFSDLDYRVSARDVHWNRAGHERVAMALYGWIVARDLLPGLHLAEWDAADDVARSLSTQAHLERSVHRDFAAWQASLWNVPVIDFREPDAEALSDVHGGVHPGGLVGAYASMFLANHDATRLRLDGRCLDRPELDGASVRVFLDEQEVATIPLRQDEPIALDVPVPPALRARPFLGVRLLGDDYLYQGDRLRTCVTMRLDRVALEP